MNRNESLPQEAPQDGPKKELSKDHNPKSPKSHPIIFLKPPGPGRGTLWGFSAKPDPPLQYTGLLLWVSEPPTTRKDL
jgi:hypothetical protein